MRKLTRKQQAFVQELVRNPSLSTTQAVKKVYGAKSYAAQRSIASENMTKPNIQLELAKYSKKAEDTLLEVMNYSNELGKMGNTAGASYAAVSVSAAKDVLDRVHGKATQKIEQHSTSVNLNLSLADITLATDQN